MKETPKEITDKIGQLFRLSKHLNFNSDYLVVFIFNHNEVYIRVNEELNLIPIIEETINNFESNPSGKILQLKRLANRLTTLKNEKK